MKLFIGVGVMTLLLAACATTPSRDDQVDQARAEIQTLQQDALAQQAASDALRAAQERLQDAEAALEQHRPVAIVEHFAYLARRHAQAGEARVQAAHARAEVALAQAERNRILLAKRSQEAAERAHETEEARRQSEAARQQLGEARHQLAEAQQQLAELHAKSTERGVIVTLGDVLFDNDRASLKPGADISLERLARYLTSHPQTRILVEGHTDSRGSDEYNQSLSERRAKAVADALIARGVSPDSVRAVGRGKGFPVATNDTQAGRQQNRRVDIVLSDSSGRFAEGDAEAPVRR
jgi:outer membrane protein OmpA-like peptidoglycan-associated protein